MEGLELASRLLQKNLFVRDVTAKLKLQLRFGIKRILRNLAKRNATIKYFPYMLPTLK